MADQVNAMMHANPGTTAANGGDVVQDDGLPLWHRVTNLVLILLPFAGVIAAAALVWGRGFDWLNAILFFAMYVLSGFGVTVGFHRLFTHRSFETSRVLQVILATLGSMAVEGPILHWVAVHRSHHHHSDREDDPHSPHRHGSGFWNMIRGLWWAHVGWMYTPGADDLHRYVKDLAADRVLKWISRMFPLWVAIGLLIPTVLGGLLTMSFSGAFLGFLWGGLVRVFFVHHLTWSINSACHIWGAQPFRTRDHSRNNPIFGVLAFGEGWHNNHHAFPTSARHGLRWWQIDVSYGLIWLLWRLGLVWNVRIPSPARITARAR